MSPVGKLMPRTAEVLAKTNARILVVEDEEMVAESIRRVLEREGYEADVAVDGDEGLQFFTARTYDLVISDINMPGTDGISFVRTLREMSEDVPVILMTGRPTIDTAIEAVEYSVFQYLTKPFRVQEFRDAVRQALVHRRMALIREEALSLTLALETANTQSRLRGQYLRALGTMWFAYQPIVDRNWDVFGYEALLRNEESSLRAPQQLLAAAEELGRVDELARHIRDAAPTPFEDRTDGVWLFMNIDPPQLKTDVMLTSDDKLASMADRVVLEITERASLNETPDMERKIFQLKEMGYRIAVDDLGAGYSGLSSFAQLEPDFVKLDGTLVRDVDRNDRKQRLIRSMASLCNEMGIQVVAEGVETQEEFEMLVEAECHLFQGFFIGRPAPLK